MTGPYGGGELDLFAEATNWKKYWASTIQESIRGDVLEVGAGIGANTPFLKCGHGASWTCLEPDPVHAERIRHAFSAQPALADCKVETATIAGLRPGLRFDTILYIDVLEHIADDRLELQRAARLLRDGGRIVVLVPAHQSLYTPFDKANGHFRRYGRQSLTACSPDDCEMTRLIYLDSVGLLASMSNRFILRRSRPTRGQILFWDRAFVLPSRYLDRLTGHKIGKSIIAIWQKRDSNGRVKHHGNNATAS
jgi:SAM-dependent methyltransferase